MWWTSLWNLLKVAVRFFTILRLFKGLAATICNRWGDVHSQLWGEGWERGEGEIQINHACRWNRDERSQMKKQKATKLPHRHHVRMHNIHPLNANDTIDLYRLKVRVIEGITWFTVLPRKPITFSNQPPSKTFRLYWEQKPLRGREKRSICDFFFSSLYYNVWELKSIVSTNVVVMAYAEILYALVTQDGRREIVVFVSNKVAMCFY